MIPRPDSLTVGRGRFVIGPSTVIYTDASTADIARRFAASLFPATGLSIPVRVGAPTGASAITLERNARLTRLGDEGYELTVTPRRVTIRGRERAGVFYALQSVRQLLPPDVFRDAKPDSVVWSVPAVRIVDERETGVHGEAVEKDRAGAARAPVAAHLRSRQAPGVA